MKESELKSMPALTRAAVSGLSADQRKVFSQEYQVKRYGAGGAYGMWLLLGLHYAYLGRWGTQVIFWLTGGGLIVWWLLDLLRVPMLVRNKNADIATAIVASIRQAGV